MKLKKSHLSIDHRLSNHIALLVFFQKNKPPLYYIATLLNTYIACVSGMKKLTIQLKLTIGAVLAVLIMQTISGIIGRKRTARYQ